MQIESSAVSPTSETAPTKVTKSKPVEKVESFEKVETKEIVFNEKSLKIEKNDVEQLQELQKTLAEQNIALRFSRDADTKILVVEMVNDETGEAILQLPSKVSLKLAAENAKLQGLFVNETV